MKGVQEKKVWLLVVDRKPRPSWSLSGITWKPDSDPRYWFFYLSLTPIIDPYFYVSSQGCPNRILHKE